jgi:hypothetical protein
MSHEHIIGSFEVDFWMSVQKKNKVEDWLVAFHRTPKVPKNSKKTSFR